MGLGDGDGGYGFARRGNPVRRKIGRRSAVPGRSPSSQHADYGYPSTYAGDSAAEHRPPWIWLLIGFLLGTGSTLLTASFWLPENTSRHIVELDDGEPSPASDQKVAEVAQPRLDQTEVAALDVDEPAETHDAATTDTERPLPRTDEAEDAAPAMDETEAAPPDLGELAATPGTERLLPRVDGPEEDIPDEATEIDIAAKDTPSIPPDTSDTDESNEPTVDARQASDDSVTALLDPRDALVELTATTVSPPVEEVVETLPEDLSDPPVFGPSEPAANPPSPADQDQAELTSPDPPDSPGPSDETTANERPISAEPDEADTAGDLPPRIRDALQAARAEAPVTAGANASRSGRLYRVQLAAVDNETAARVYWREVNDRLPGVFSDVEPIFDQRTVGQRLFVRVWVGAFDNRGDADGYCGWLKQQGQDCFVTRVDSF